VWEAGSWEEGDPDRVLATILFTDIVGSTAKAIELGDRAKDLVAGSGLRFRDRGTAALKGVPDEWQLYALDQAG
jgi:class 3 adenylate cyclase